MKVLAITNLFPNNVQPGRAVFNLQQFERLNALCELKVVAPVPWYPNIFPSMGKSRFPQDVVERERINGLDVYHPRHLITPKIGRSLYGRWMYWGLRGAVKEIRKNFPFDAIFTAWAYPDAYASMLIARDLNVPYLVQVHGSDINVLPQMPARRERILEALNNSSGVICVSTPLVEKVRAMGVPQDKIHLIFSGINKKMFFRKDKKEVRQALGLSPEFKHIVFVGNLVPIKGVKHLIGTLPDLPDEVQIHILGDGEEKERLQVQAKALRGSERIIFHGRKPHAEIPQWMNAADIFCLPSLNEGSPNVILEALACGTPVVSTRVGGIPELLSDSSLGYMADPQDTGHLGTYLKIALIMSWDGQVISDYAQRFDWDDNAKTVHELLKAAINRHVSV